jgi:hypothetical protein
VRQATQCNWQKEQLTLFAEGPQALRPLPTLRAEKRESIRTLDWQFAIQYPK